MTRFLRIPGLLPFLMGSAALWLLAACGSVASGVSSGVKGSGVVVHDLRPVAGVAEVELADLGALEIAQGPTESLVVEADDNLLPLIETSMRGSRLTLKIKSNVNLCSSCTLRYHLVVRDLQSLTVSGVGSATLPALHTQDFRVTASGVGGVEIKQLDVERLRVDLSGVGSVTIAAGRTRQQAISVSGTGSYDAKGLRSLDAHITLSGVGSATVACDDTLDANLSGTGQIAYSGSPRVTSRVSGVGNVHRLP